jgi:hypothetical protein
LSFETGATSQAYTKDSSGTKPTPFARIMRVSNDKYKRSKEVLLLPGKGRF